jgi:hypothetical protein
MLDEYKTEKQPNRKVNILMFFLVLIFLVIIGIWTYETFQKNVGSLNPKEGLIDDCWGYSLALSNIRYLNSTLVFELENKRYSETNIKKITLISNKIEITYNLSSLTPGQKRTITISNVSIYDQFYAYPDECYEQGKIYKIGGQ